MDIGQAMKIIRQGGKVTRRSWKNAAFLWLKPAGEIKAEWCKDETLKLVVQKNGGSIHAMETICIKTPDNQIHSGWTPSQDDLMADDFVRYPDADSLYNFVEKTVNFRIFVAKDGNSITEDALEEEMKEFRGHILRKYDVTINDMNID